VGQILSYFCLDFTNNAIISGISLSFEFYARFRNKTMSWVPKPENSYEKIHNNSLVPQGEYKQVYLLRFTQFDDIESSNSFGGCFV